MPKRRALSFKECLALMRKHDPQLAEDGFHYLLPRASEFVPQLLEAFETEEARPLRCWLLELIGEARSKAAFPVLCEQAVSSDESLSAWGVRGLKLLNTYEARTFLFEHDLKG